MDDRIKRLVIKNDEIYDEVHEVNGKLTVAANARVVPTSSPKDNHMFVLIKNNDDLDDYYDGEVMYKYYCMRIMAVSYKASVGKHKQRHPDMEVLMKISYSPNSINLFKRVKEELEGKIKISGCSFNLKSGFTESKLLKTIERIHNERLNTDDI